MSDEELASLIHRKTILFQHDMNSNVGEQNAWTEVGTPDWSNTDYLVLNQLESVTSHLEFRYGVLTFDARSTDWTLAAMGFYLDGVNNVMFWADNFDAYKHSIHGGPDAITLTDNTWYHFVIIWCPQFVSIEVYGLDGTLAGYSKLRSTPNKRMPVLFYALNAAVSLDIAAVTVQEGDDPAFFLTKRDHVICTMDPHNGATYATGQPGAHSILCMNTNSEIRGYATIREGYSRFRAKLFYWRSETGTTDWRTWMSFHYCDTIYVAGTFNLENNIFRQYPLVNDQMMCVYFPCDASCNPTGWWALNGRQAVFEYWIRKVANFGVYMQGFVLEFE